MSRSNPVQTNPARHFFTWSGSEGKLSYYDKEKKENIVVDLPFEFMVVDELSTITGFAEQDKSSYWSNEVRSVTRDPLTVKTSAGTKQSGLYKDLTDVRSKGAKYAKSIYIVYMENDEYILSNIKASGAALTAWIEFSKTVIVTNGKICLTGSKEGKKGKTIYQIPIFEWEHTSAEEDEIAIDLDKILQDYLLKYLSSEREDDIVIEDIPDEITMDNVQDNIDETRKKEQEEIARQVTAKVEADNDKEEIDLKDIPY